MQTMSYIILHDHKWFAGHFTVLSRKHLQLLYRKTARVAVSNFLTRYNALRRSHDTQFVCTSSLERRNERMEPNATKQFVRTVHALMRIYLQSEFRIFSCTHNQISSRQKKSFPQKVGIQSSCKDRYSKNGWQGMRSSSHDSLLTHSCNAKRITDDGQTFVTQKPTRFKFYCHVQISNVACALLTYRDPRSSA